MKRLLAYSSIENIGLIVAGFGLTLIFRGFGMGALAALALTATLYHCLNHACYKSLLFLCTGSVLHATRERSLGRLGGLIHRMPWVAWCALVGTIAIAGLPPSNGFVSEWLLLQAFLFTPGLPQGYLNMLVPVAAAVVALTAALSGYVMVKFYGVVFLGQPREAKLAEAHDAGIWERDRPGLARHRLRAARPGAGHGDRTARSGDARADRLAASPTSRKAGCSSRRSSRNARATARCWCSRLLAVLIALAWLAVRLFYHGRVAAHRRLGLRLSRS